MKIKRHSSKTRRRPLGARGSALLVSLMVLAGLSLLALAFVAVSETEGKISANQRNALQTQAIAEAGARAVVEFFQAPTWALSQGIMPANVASPAGPMKRTRLGIAGTTVYKPLATQRLFDLPFRPAPDHRFFGDFETADVQIDDNNAAASLRALNTFLFGANSRTAGRISEIRVYAPPIVGGVLNADKFWTGGDRFGTATIAVTAEMWSRAAGGNERDSLLSRQIVRIVVGEFPLPIPAGPVQTASNAAFGGNFEVHWGDEVALGNLNPSRTSTRLPWQNPFHRPSFEYGYDEEVWPRDNPAGGLVENPNFLQEHAGKSFEDPWVGARARGTVTTCAAGTCATYNNTSVEGQPVHAAFQGQTTTQYPVRRAVTFPTIDYAIWKRIANQGRGTKGVYYFSWDSGTGLFKRNGQGTARSIAYWVNNRGTGSKLGPGFYFFDTRTGANPQLTGGGTNAAILTPAVDWGASDFGDEFIMAGFIYMNTAQYGTQGVGNSPITNPYNMPGEVYRDIGYPEFNTGTGAWNRDPALNIVRKSIGDSEWKFQDLNGNNRFDVVVNGPLTVTSNEGGVMTTRNNVYLPIPWREGLPACTAATCSEPHEPYLNFIYPDDRDRNATIRVGWEPNATQTRAPRDLVGNAMPNCGTNPEFCTSNGHDVDGALVDIPATLNGVLYNEGRYQSQGNVDYFGSVLMKGATGATGTPRVWFDEKLIKGNWSPAGMPRVIVYSSETDEQ